MITLTSATYNNINNNKYNNNNYTNSNTMGVMKIGSYRLGRTLGVGSFSKVKLATHEPTGKKVAVKILNREQLRKEKMEEKLRREIRILKICMHPHIIRLYEVIETTNDIYVITEYSAGGELSEYINERKRLHETEARRLFQQLICGVDYCHKHMIAHRDLKPENLLLDEYNNVKIADFGLSNHMTDGCFLKTSCGSPNYAAPEVIAGHLYAGPEVDVWSCGIIVYALLCGSLPFDDESIPYLFRKIKGGLYILPSYLTDVSKDLISKMLITDPMKRINISEIRRHPWFRNDLPTYLDIPIRVSAHLELFDDHIIERAATSTNLPKDKIIKNLRKGKRNYYTVAYHLYKKEDIENNNNSNSNEKMIDDQISKVRKIEAVGNGVIGQSLNSENEPEHQREQEQQHKQQQTTTCSASSYGKGMVLEASGGERVPSFQIPSKLRRNEDIDYDGIVKEREWDVGMKCKQRTANDAMMELYRTLRTLQWQWKIPTQPNFQVRVLIQKQGLDRPVRMCLQLFKSASGYQLDVRRVDGDLIAYFASCCELKREFGG